MDKNDFKDLPDEFPDNLLSEEWAIKVHHQTLKRLNERGGMSIFELLMNLRKETLDNMINKYGYNYKPCEKDVNDLLLFLK